MPSAERAILIVEGDRSTRELYCRALSQAYEVFVSANPQEARALLCTHAIDAVILEPGPLDGGGWSLLAELKRDPSTQLIPLIVCTTQDERRRAIELGATVYLVKPVLPALLLETVSLVI